MQPRDYLFIRHPAQKVDRVGDAKLFAQLVSYLEMSEYAPDETLFAQGDTPDCLYLIYTGRVSVLYRSEDGEELRRWIDDCPNSLYSALTFQGGAAWRQVLLADLGRDRGAPLKRRAVAAMAWRGAPPERPRTGACSAAGAPSGPIPGRSLPASERLRPQWPGRSCPAPRRSRS